MYKSQNKKLTLMTGFVVLGHMYCLDVLLWLSLHFREELTYEMLALDPRASDDEMLESEASIGTADSSENLMESEGAAHDQWGNDTNLFARSSFKGIVHPKREIVLSFTRLHVGPKPIRLWVIGL